MMLGKTIFFHLTAAFGAALALSLGPGPGYAAKTVTERVFHTGDCGRVLDLIEIAVLGVQKTLTA